MCTSPLRGWLNEHSQVFKVTKSNVLGVQFNGNKIMSIYNESDLSSDSYTNYIDIPCRSCLDCYNQSRREWIARAVAESTQHDSMIFLTLTYNDSNIPEAEFVDDDGVFHYHNTLRYRDFQLFMKRLRKRFEDKYIRYMVCGEYGTRTFRPHYHAIIYGIGLQDLGLCIPHTKNSKGDTLYINDLLDNLWNLGYVLASEANTSTMAYVAGYVAKKAESKKDKFFYKVSNIVPPFIKGSNRPGLGAVWFESNKDKYADIYDYSSIGSADSEPTKIYLTSGWKRKYEKDLFIDSECDVNKYAIYEQDKADRRVKFLDNKFKLLDTDMSKSEFNDSLSIHLRNSSKRKRGVF